MKVSLLVLFLAIAFSLAVFSIPQKIEVEIPDDSEIVNPQDTLKAHRSKAAKLRVLTFTKHNTRTIGTETTNNMLLRHWNLLLPIIQMSPRQYTTWLLFNV